MSAKQLRAPGKLFWIGEYTILDGGPALVAAVDRYAVCTQSPRSDNDVTFDLDGVPFVLWRDNQPLPAGVPEGGELVAAVVRTIHDAFGPATGMNLAVDSSAMQAGTKLGLGSSGAVAAALCAMLTPDATPETTLDIALNAHRAFQNGRGSGADVVASCLGGLSRIQKGASPTPVRMPPGLQVATIFTGISANTRTLVDAYRRFQQTAAAPRITQDLQDTAAKGIAAIAACDIARWCDAVNAYAALESALTDGGVGVMTAPVQAAVSVANACGWAAKPSGAGGGDVVVAFAGPDADPESLRSAVAAAGLEWVPLALAPRGVLDLSRPDTPAGV